MQATETKTHRPLTNIAIKPRALVVDDDQGFRQTLVEILQLNGFQVDSAENGLEALKLYQLMPNQINLILLDMRMPVMDGRQTFEEVKKINPDQKIIIITGYSEYDDLRNIREEADGFVKKPFNVFDLIRICRVALGIKYAH